jgi:tRNA threonylcarbamoyladenosine biosynthesis protein TsaE
MMRQHHVTRSEAETIALGRSLAPRLRPGDVVCLDGDLGAGKTRFVQGVCSGLGVRGHVTSPTFTIMNRYDGAAVPVYHFDFYRIRSLDELTDLGFTEYRDGGGICLIEWAAKADGLLPERRYDIQMSLGPDEESRIIELAEAAA